MEIKRTQPGQANWNGRAGEAGPAKEPAKAGDAGLGEAAGSSAFQAIRSEFRRADLGSARWQTILERSVGALLDSTVTRTGALPEGAREKLSALLIADPIFSKRLLNYWDQNLN